MIKHFVILGATSTMLAAAEFLPEQWIGLLAKAGVQVLLSIVVVAEGFVCAFLLKKLLARNEKSEELLAEASKSQQAVADAVHGLTDEVSKSRDSTAEFGLNIKEFSTVIKRCKSNETS